MLFWDVGTRYPDYTIRNAMLVSQLRGLSAFVSTHLIQSETAQRANLKLAREGKEGISE